VSQAATLLRFKIELSDIDRATYETLDFRLAMHPSETPAFLLCRVLAFCLNFREGLEFSPGGLSDTDEPAIRALHANGAQELWIEIGNPSAKRVHKGSKSAKAIKIYTYKDSRAFLQELEAATIHRKNELEIYAFDPRFLDRLAAHIERDNRWTIVHVEGALTISIGDVSEQGEVQRKMLSSGS
jgi:uncharacterized protein YaeQ